MLEQSVILPAAETGDENVVLKLQFRQAVMGGIVNTLVNDTPVITTNGWGK